MVSFHTSTHRAICSFTCYVPRIKWQLHVCNMKELLRKNPLYCNEVDWHDRGSGGQKWTGHFFYPELSCRHRFEKNRAAKLLCSSWCAIRSPSTLILITGCLQASSLSSSILPSLCLPHRGWFMSAVLGRVGWRGRDTAAEVERERRRREGKEKRGKQKAKSERCIRGENET